MRMAVFIVRTGILGSERVLDEDATAMIGVIGLRQPFPSVERSESTNPYPQSAPALVAFISERVNGTRNRELPESESQKRRRGADTGKAVAVREKSNCTRSGVQRTPICSQLANNIT